MSKAQLIRRALADRGQLIMPGVYDALSAKVAARAGFEVIFITGYSLSATLLGEPDFGLLTQTEVVSAAQRICSVVDTPVIVDADTGYGNAINVVRTVQDLIRAGAGGMFLEAPESKEEMKEIAKRVPAPLVANMLERGVTPLMGPKELKELGFDLVVWPLAPLYSVAKSLTEVYTTLRRDGSTLAILDRLMPFDEFNGIVGLY